MAQISIGPGSFTGAAAVARLRLSLFASSQQTGDVQVDFDELYNAYSIWPAVTHLDSAAGDNTVTVPITKAGGVLIRPPDANTSVLKLKGAAGDTGITISKVGWTLITFDTAPMASFILNSAAIVSGIRFYWF